MDTHVLRVSNRLGIASGDDAGKVEAREAALAARADEASCTILYVNLVGGQDELVFDGASLLVSPDGEVTARAGQYTEELMVVDVEIADGEARAPALPVVTVSSASAATGATRRCPTVEPLEPIAEVYGALGLDESATKQSIFRAVRKARAALAPLAGVSP